MSTQKVRIEAAYEAGVLKLAQPLPLADQQRVAGTGQVPACVPEWPADVAAIYGDLHVEDRRLTAAMWQTVNETWPRQGSSVIRKLSEPPAYASGHCQRKDPIMFSSLRGEEPAMKAVLQQLLEENSFTPIRIRMTGRHTADVLRAELAEVGDGVLTLYVADENEPDNRRMTSILSLDHIVSIEDLVPDEPTVVG